MKDLFPYVGKPITVTKDMCDFNGHMNVNYIKKVFEQGWDFVNTDFGFNEDYFNEGFSSFTLEDNYRFKKEFLLDDKIFPKFRLLNVNEKLYHLMNKILHNLENKNYQIIYIFVVYYSNLLVDKMLYIQKNDDS